MTRYMTSILKKVKKKWKELWYSFLLKRKKAVHYIGGSEVLPPPLSRDEEEILIQKLIEFAEQEEEIKAI